MAGRLSSSDYSSSRLTSLALIALLHLLPWLDPKLRGERGTSERMRAVLPILRLSFAAFFLIIFLLLFGAALGHSDLVGRIIPTAVLFLLAVTGNYLGNVRPNYFVGFRTPWTLESPATWRATHRLGGRLLFFSSIALLLFQFFVSRRLFFVALTATMLVLVGWTFLYSWHHFRNDGSTSRPL